jgi:hypothetical protein
VIKLKQLLKEDEAENELKSILKQDYATFVGKLGDNIKDQKFIDAIKSLAGKAPISTKDIQADVKKLRPTQNEVVLDKSLSYPLKDPTSAKTYLNGGVVAVAGKSIVTAGDGKYVIDGHHRWSQLYCINPESKIKAIDLPISDPLKALKATQIGIAAQIGSVPTATGGGTNLFTIDESTLKKYVIDNIQEPVVNVFKEAGKGGTPEEIADYIWGNVQLLKKDSTPVPGAPKRDVMPQTDDAPKFADNSFHPEKVGESKNIKLMTLLSVK